MFINVLCILTIFVNASFCSSGLTGHIVGGVYASTEDFPHSAYLAIQCKSNQGNDRHGCGSSIINQYFVLSAAHCFEDCFPMPHSFVGVSVGSHSIKEGFTLYRADSFYSHEYYDTYTIENDISLVKLLYPMQFTRNIKKVALVRSPPQKEPGEVAGWGLINEDSRQGTNTLKSTIQKIIPRPKCLKLLDFTPRGTICAGYERPKGLQGYVAEGDSGSGLVVRKYILVGIVSYKLPDQSNTVSIFTEAAHFYDWITRTSSRLFCHPHAGGGRQPPRIPNRLPRKKNHRTRHRRPFKYLRISK